MQTNQEQTMLPGAAQSYSVEVAGKMNPRLPSTTTPYTVVTLLYSWNHPRKGHEVDKMQVNMIVQSPRAAIERAKAAATNLGIKVNTKEVKQVLSNKYEKPHVGRKQIAKGLRAKEKKLP